MQMSWLHLRKASGDKGNQWPMVAHIKALRWQNHNDSEAHLSTTRFHMQVAALLAHWPDSLPLCPYHRLARPQQ